MYIDPQTSRRVRLLAPALLFTLSLMLPAPATADTLHVPSALYPTIPDAFAAAVADDEIVVYDGTHTGAGFRDLEFPVKKITLRSDNGPANCIIDLQGSAADPHYFLDFAVNTSLTRVVQGFTIRNGYWSVGGAISIGPHCSAVITGNVFENNEAETDGGAVYAINLGEVTYNTFTGNTAGSRGGAIFLKNYPTASGNTIVGNSALEGGGIHTSGYSGEISDNIIRANSAGAGGGIYTYSNGLTVVADNLIVDNTAGSGAGVFCYWYSTLDFNSNTVASNTATSSGGAVYVDRASTVDAVNSIFWGNEALYGKELYVSYHGTGCRVDMDCCDFNQRSSAVALASGSVVTYANMTYLDPAFCDPAAGIYHLAASSCCLPADQPSCGLIGARGQGCGAQTIGVAITAAPASGTLPFNTQLTIALNNLCIDQARRISARVNFNLAAGGIYTNWRAGWTNLTAGNSYTAIWNQNLPALGTLVGDNVFSVHGVDVTPAPYNQAPFWPSANTDTDSATVTGALP